MEHEVHEGEAVGILHMLHAVKGVGLILLLLGLGEAVEVVVGAQVVVRGDEEAAGAGGGVLDDIGQLGLHHGDHAVDERARGEVLAGTGFLFVGVLFEQPFIHVAQAFLLGGIPVELVDLGDERGECGGLFDEGTGVGEDFPRKGRAVGAEVNESDLVELQTVGRTLGLQIRPTMALGNLVLGASLLGHFQEEEVGQLSDVLVIGDPVVLEDVAEVPELGDDVVCHIERMKDKWELPGEGFGGICKKRGERLVIGVLPLHFAPYGPVADL